MKKKLPKYQFAGENPCGPGTIWDATQKKCVPSTQQVDPVFDNALWGNPSLQQGQAIINPNAITPPIMRTTGDATKGFNINARQVNGKVIPSNVQAIFRGYNNEILPDINAGRKDKAGNWIADKNVIGDAIDKGFNYDSDGVYRKTETKIDKNNLGYSAGFKALNVGLDLTRLIGGSINDFKNTKEEQEKLLAARYKTAKYNNYESGLNNVPVYAQYGAEIENGGGKKRKKDNTVTETNYGTSGIQYNNGKTVLHPTVDQSLLNLVDYLNHNWSDQATNPSNVYRPEFQHLAVEDNIIQQNQLPIAKYGINTMAVGGDVSIVDYLDEQGEDSSFKSRKMFAVEMGIKNYTGTAEQNIKMLAALKASGPASDMVDQKGNPVGEQTQNNEPTIIKTTTTTTTKKGKAAEATPSKAAAPVKKTVAPVGVSGPNVGSKEYNDAWQQYANKTTKNPNAPQRMDVSELGQNSYAFMNEPNQANGQTRKEKQLESGVVVDKRTGKAFQIKNGQIVKEYPVLTGKNVDGNGAPSNDLGDNAVDIGKVTPAQYYKIGDNLNDINDHNIKEYNGNIRSLEPIMANGVPFIKTEGLGIHQTHNPAERDKLYNSSTPWASYGCVNCRPQDAMELIQQNQGDTMRVVDTKNLKDKQYLESYKGKYAIGGDTSKNDKAIAAAALNGGSINGSKLTAKQKKHFKFVLEGKIPLHGHVKDAKKAGTYEIGGEADIKMLLDNEDLDQMQNGGIPDRYKKEGFTKVGAKRKSNHPGKKWMVLAKKGDKYKVVHGGDSSMQDFSQHHDKQRQKNFWNRMGHSSDPFSARYWHAKFNTWADGGTVDEVEQTNMQPNAEPKYKDGGNIPISENVPVSQANAELEAGEILQDNSGDISKVSDQANTHEEGGSMQADVHRVLEDTSDKRKDKISKALRVTPAEAELIVGFKPKSTVSHSKLYELAHTKNEAELKRTETLIGKNLDFIKYNNGGKYAQNSAEENLKILQTAKRKEDIFNDIFDHQENIKQQEAMLTEQKQMQYGGVPKYAVGGDTFDINPYSGGKTKKGRYTPTGKDNAYNKDKDYLKRWEDIFPGISTWDNKKAQETIYNFKLTTPEGRKEIRDMWSENGLTTAGRNQPALEKLTNNGVFDPKTLENDQTLAQLRNGYADGYFGRRQLEPDAVNPAQPATPAQPQKSYGFIGPVDDNNPTPTAATPAAGLPQYKQPTPITPSELHSPLGLSGGLGNVLGYIGASGRTPVDLEQLDRTPLRVHEVNPLPTLLENQGDYNAAINQLPNNGVGFANIANLAGQKYKVNNSVLGQYENTNKQKYDQIDQYNDQAQYQLDGTNLQLRDQFVNRVLTGEEKQRLQKQEYANSFFKAVDERNAFDANGNLALKLSPYFNAKGEFNGNDYNITAKYMAETGNSFKYDVDAKGNTFRTMYDKNGKMVPNSRIINDKSASKNIA